MLREVIKITGRPDTSAHNKCRRNLPKERYSCFEKFNICIRTCIISQLFEDHDLTVKEDVSQDLKPSQISRNSTYLAKLIKMINLNNEVASFLLNVEIGGREAREKFIEECIEDTRQDL